MSKEQKKYPELIHREKDRDRKRRMYHRVNRVQISEERTKKKTTTIFNTIYIFVVETNVQ